MYENPILISGTQDQLEDLGFSISGPDDFAIIAGTSNPSKGKKVKVEVMKSKAEDKQVPPLLEISVKKHAEAAIPNQVATIPAPHADKYLGCDLFFISGDPVKLTGAKIGRREVLQFNDKAMGDNNLTVAKQKTLGGTADISGGPVVYRMLLDPDQPLKGEKLDAQTALILTFTGAVSDENTILEVRLWKDVPNYGSVNIININS
jgi:hypothetical protein